MGENSRTNSQNLFHILGFGTICRACKAFLSKCYPEKHSLFRKKKANKTNHISIDQEDNTTKKSIKQGSNKDNMQEKLESRQRISCEDYITRSPQWSPRVSASTSPSRLSRTASYGGPSPFSRSATSRRNQNPVAPAKATLLRTMSQRTSSDAYSSAFPRSFSRSTSKTGSTPILYSNSNGLMKPPAMEKQLDCTLDELCFGCIKKIKIARDAVTDNGQIVEQDEVLTIKVKPGWRKGTKITFEGVGNEIRGTYPADVVFVVAEKKHPFFTRQDDDLELRLEIPLVEALTGCNLSVPLLGEQTMNLTIDDMVHPGYQKIIAGQGMPKQNEPKTRGNLVITFSVKFPEKLTEEQRSDAANILQHAY
ncbi:hypothetical protein CDL12_27629 [Handroanthus impetiginosus]|uniref:Chaperone DnaJ C-terminal domain-containing protein n=1 Tax=Handroanthus impetiginosus TaxID=429701 RepID=A0A2G9G3I8_9LAMI|nr:hypothetical protein CDL12_27629 [Handroanthus impetiginosus]